MIVYMLYSSIILCVSQAEESVAEEKMHSKERIPHHLSRHSQWTEPFLDYAETWWRRFNSLVCCDWRLNATHAHSCCCCCCCHSLLLPPLSGRLTVRRLSSTCSPARWNTTPRRRGASTSYPVSYTYRPPSCVSFLFTFFMSQKPSQLTVFTIQVFFNYNSY